MSFAGKRRRREAAEAMEIGAMAARGDPKDLKKQLKDLRRD